MHAVRWLASPRQGELTHTRSVCVGVAETGGEKAKAKAKVKAKAKSKSKSKSKKQKAKAKAKVKAKAKAKATYVFMMPEGKALPFAAKS